MKPTATCSLCSGPPHDLEQHEATLSIHRWLRERVRTAIRPVDTTQKKPAVKPTEKLALSIKKKAAAR